MDRAAIKKQLAEQKLKAFSIGMNSKKTMSKKEQEELKKKEQEVAAAQAFEEFIATFQDTSNSKSTSKVWVKAGTYDAGRRKEDTSERGKLYKPQSRYGDKNDGGATSKMEEYAKLLGDKKPDSNRLKKKNDKDKKKSNLEMFKEELKMIQEEREERHKYKNVIKSSSSSTYDNEPETSLSPNINLFTEETKGSFDSGDPNTTNLYLGNINPKLTEQQLMEIFGKYGPLASIKIMWPRTDEEKARGRNCGFVAFMSRKDGERALKYLNGKDIQSFEMKLGWGKSVPIPSYPIYVPPKLMELYTPPPPSGLPFNAQPSGNDKAKLAKFKIGEVIKRDQVPDFDKILSQAYVKVVVPSDRTLLMTIHRMVEFVVREGPMFEAMIMNREINNPIYRFLFENQSPAHVYYRWKMFSILQGDQPKEWKTQEFRMFEGGSIWKPPHMNVFTQGMAEELVEEEVLAKTKGTLSNSQRNRLEDFLRNLSPEKIKIAEAMVFCMEHSDAAEEICECIMESLSNETTAVHKKIARLYLVSDILHNCGIKIQNASFYRRGFESRLVKIFTDMHNTYESLESRLQAEGLRTRVMQVFRAWEDWAVYPKDFLIKLQNIFLGLSADSVPDEVNDDNASDEDLDGAPLSEDEEDLDGVPLDGNALLKAARQNQKNEDDIDGIPLEEDEDLDGIPMDNGLAKTSKPSGGAAFIPSKWETVNDDDDSAAPSKWDDIELNEPPPVTTSSMRSKMTDMSSERQTVDSPEDDVSLDGREGDNDDRRAKLRVVEVKVMQYQDELESGRKSIKSGWTLSEQVQHYRKKLIRKANREEKKEAKSERSEWKKERSPSPSSPDRSREYSQSKKKRARSDSSSPPRKSRRSPSYDSPYRKPSSSSSTRSPSSHRSKELKKYHLSPSPPHKQHKRKHSSPSPTRHKYHTSKSPPSSRSSKHSRHASPSSPPVIRKHKHKHKY